MGQAAYSANVRIGGVSTAFADETLSSNGDFTTFTMDDPIKRALDDEAEITFFEDENPIAESDILDVNSVTGTVTFASDKTGDITASGRFIPLQTFVLGVTQYSVELGGDILDSTHLAQTSTDGGYRGRTYGLRDVSVSLTRHDDLSGTFKDKWRASERVLLELTTAGGKQVIRGWFVIEAPNSSGEVSGLEEEALSFQLARSKGTNFTWSRIND